MIPSGSNREAESTDAPERGGLLRSSVEAGVMPVERRGWVTAVGSGQPATGGQREDNVRRPNATRSVSSNLQGKLPRSGGQLPSCSPERLQIAKPDERLRA